MTIENATQYNTKRCEVSNTLQFDEYYSTQEHLFSMSTPKITCAFDSLYNLRSIDFSHTLSKYCFWLYAYSSFT